MANTFLLSNNFNIGTSLVEKEFVDVCKKIQKKAKLKKCKILLPVDVVCSKDIKNNNDIIKTSVEKVYKEHMILDIGEKSIKLILDEVKKSRSILWNGPLGAFEYKPFDLSTKKIAISIKNFSKTYKIDTLAGGGDTLSAIKNANAEDGFNYLSNAGGAFLEWLEGNKSPGVIALEKNNF